MKEENKRSKEDGILATVFILLLPLCMSTGVRQMNISKICQRMGLILMYRKVKRETLNTAHCLKEFS